MDVRRNVFLKSAVKLWKKLLREMMQSLFPLRVFKMQLGVGLSEFLRNLNNPLRNILL